MTVNYFRAFLLNFFPAIERMMPIKSSPPPKMPRNLTVTERRFAARKTGTVAAFDKVIIGIIGNSVINPPTIREKPRNLVTRALFLLRITDCQIINTIVKIRDTARMM